MQAVSAGSEPWGSKSGSDRGMVTALADQAGRLQNSKRPLRLSGDTRSAGYPDEVVAVVDEVRLGPGDAMSWEVLRSPSGERWQRQAARTVLGVAAVLRNPRRWLSRPRAANRLINWWRSADERGRPAGPGRRSGLPQPPEVVSGGCHCFRDAQVAGDEAGDVFRVVAELHGEGGVLQAVSRAPTAWTICAFLTTLDMLLNLRRWWCRP